MAISPSTNLKLLKCPLALDNKNQLTFANADAQFNYFNSLPKIEIEEISYQRHSSSIFFPAHIDNLLEYNYVMYQNNNYNSKWFYAFITGMRYINDYNTEIFISTDVFQTWQFNITWKKSFIEREMLNPFDDDGTGNLQPEGLETGEYVVTNTYDIDALYPVAVVAYTRNPKEDGLTEETPVSQGVIANGIPNGMYFCFVSLNGVQGVLNTINSSGHGDAVMTVFTIPACAIIGFSGWTLEDIKSGVLKWLVADFKALSTNINIPSAPLKLDGYEPRNKKLLSYPYTYLAFNPANGSSKVFKYENFLNGIVSFSLQSEINQNPSAVFIPKNYRKAGEDSLQDAVTLSGYPVLGWITDYYNTWLAQNSKIIELQNWQEEYTYNNNLGLSNAELLQNVTGAFSSALGKNLSGVASAGVNTALTINNQKMLNQNHGQYIQMQLAIKEQHKMLPNTGSLASSNATLIGYNKITKNIFTRYTIKKEFAEQLDNYFDMFGYLTNNVKLPNLNNRPNWNYIKTIGANITGNIPQENLEDLKNIFDSGVTLWHNPATFLDYSKNNRDFN